MASLGPAVYEIDPEGDLVVRVVEYDSVVFRAADGTRRILKEGLMKVNRQVLIDNSAPFKAILDGYFAEGRQDKVDMKGQSIAAVEL